MNNLYGIKGVKIKVFDNRANEVNEVNSFLSKYDGNIIDIQIVSCEASSYDFNKIMVIYKE